MENKLKRVTASFVLALTFGCSHHSKHDQDPLPTHTHPRHTEENTSAHARHSKHEEEALSAHGHQKTVDADADDETASAEPGSDFSPEYRQQIEQAEKEAEQTQKNVKRRDKRVDEEINRSDRREK
jgi:hypothetical protein